jgi:hypothetical protein
MQDQKDGAGEMIFEHMNKIQQRLHNAAIVLDADGEEYGFAQLQRDAIDEIEKLRISLCLPGQVNRKDQGLVK